MPTTAPFRKLWVVVATGILIVVAIFVVSHESKLTPRDKSPKQQQHTEQTAKRSAGTPIEESDSRSLGKCPAPKITGASTTDSASDRQTAVQFAALLEFPIGQITDTEAIKRIEDLIKAPGSRSFFEEKLKSGNLSEKLLATYALVESGNLTFELLTLLLNDPSAYVQAEAFHCLFRKGDFAQADTLLGERLKTLDWSKASDLLDLATNEGKPNLPVALARLGLDEGLPLYLDLLADRSPTLRLAAFTRLNDQQTSAETKVLMLKLVDSTPGPELVERLKVAFAAETNPTVRIRFAQYIAARSSANDEQLVVFLKAGMPPSLPSVGQVDLRFSERRIETLREFEKSLMLGISTGSFDAMEINGTLTAYLKEGAMVGLDHLSKETLLSASNYLRGSSYAYAPDSIALAAYVASRTK